MLFARIRESFEMKYDDFKGLKGLRVKEMKKFQPMLQNQKQEIIIYN